MEDKIYLVKNRSASSVVYSIPEDNIRREFMPGETKRIPYSELEKLSYVSGGATLIANYLLVQKEVLNELGLGAEREYFLDEQGVIDLIKNASLEVWEDALDFAPEGVRELIKKLSVELPLSDYNKRQAMIKMWNFDVDKAIASMEPEKEVKPAEKTEAPVAPGKKTRRVTEEEAVAPKKYNVTHRS